MTHTDTSNSSTDREVSASGRAARPERRFLAAALLGMTAATMTTSCGPGRDRAPEQTDFVTQADTDFFETHFISSKNGLSDLASTISGIYGYADKVQLVVNTMGKILGMNDETSMESRITAKLVAIEADVKQVLATVQTEDELNRWRDIETKRGQAMSASTLARDWARQNMTPTLGDAQTMLDESYQGANDLTAEAYWRRPYDEQANAGNWKNVITARPPTSATTFDYRGILPTFMQAVAARLTVLAVAEPDFATGFSSELDNYRVKLQTVKDTINGGISCGYQVFTVWPQGNFRIDAICADIYTGASAVSSASGYLASLSTFGGNCSWNQNSPVWVKPDLSKYEKACFNKVMQLAPMSSVFFDLMTNGFDDATVQVRNSAGLFEVQRMIDNLKKIEHNFPGPNFTDNTFRIPSFFPDRCIDLDLSGGSAQGAPAVLGACSNSNAGASQGWIYDATTSEILNAYLLILSGGAQRYCLDAQWGSTRRQTPIWLWPCNGGDAQRWTYDWDPGYFRHVGGRVLDVQWGNSNVGTPLWLYDENPVPNAAQIWGPGYW